MNALQGRFRARLAVEWLEDRNLLSLYTFTPIADTDGDLSSFGRAPALNNLGLVAFTAKNSNGIDNVYTGDGMVRTTIGGPSSSDETLDLYPSVNDSGTAAFVLRSSQTERIVDGNGGPLTTLYQRGDFGFFSFGPAALNQSGVVAFWTSTYILSIPEEVMAGDGGEPTRIDRSESFGFTTFGTAPSLNDAGTVAYSYMFRGPTSENAIKIGAGEKPTTLYSDHGDFFSSFGNPVVNATQTVAFYATLKAGNTGIFQGDGGPVTIIAKSGGAFTSFGTAPSQNNPGAVAFFATLRDGRSGIFTGPNPDGDQVIRTGDNLLDSQVDELGFFRQGLNDNGQVAFFAHLSNGRSGIFRADPIGTTFGPQLVGLWATGEMQPRALATSAGADSIPSSTQPSFIRPATGGDIGLVSGVASDLQDSPSLMASSSSRDAAVDALFQDADQGWGWLSIRTR